MKGFFLEDWPPAPAPDTTEIIESQAEIIIQQQETIEEQKLIIAAQRDALTGLALTTGALRTMVAMDRKAKGGIPIFASLN